MSRSHPCPTAPRRRRLLAALALCPLASPSLLHAQPAGGAQRPPPASRPGAYTELRWDDLVPKGWDPLKAFRDKGITNLAALNDADPKVADLMRAMRETWDNAPTEAALEGHRVKLPGYVVPLEEDKAGLTEFLLVPYFGACIHSPPPPANQIVVVSPEKPAPFKTMDTVWVSGVLRIQRNDSPMGTAGYRLETARVERYQAAPR